VAKGRKKPSEHWKGSKPDPKASVVLTKGSRRE